MDVLYVDDDAEDREIFKEAFKMVSPEISVTDFSSGKEILEFLNSNSTVPRYIFIDINMPVMNGHECAYQIKEARKFDPARIVMYSTTFNPNDIKKFDEQNCRYLVKPSQFSSLVDILRELVNTNPI